MFETPASQSPKSRPRRLRWAVAVLSLLLIGGAGAVAIQRGYFQWPVPGAAEDPYALGLRVEQHGENLHVTWDRNSRALALAQQALLTIADGDRLQVIELGRQQLQSGSVIYRPMGDRVSFRLELRWGRWGLTETASWEGSK